MAPLTVFLAKLIGLYCVLFGLAMALQKQAMVEMVASLLRDGPPLFILEAIAVTVGLAIVIGHNVWSGGALPVIVTLLGWIILIRGVALLFLSPTAKIRFFEKSGERMPRKGEKYDCRAWTGIGMEPISCQHPQSGVLPADPLTQFGNRSAKCGHADYKWSTNG